MFGLSTFSNSKMLLNMLLPLSGILAELSKNTALTRLALYLWAAHAAATKLIPAVQGVVGGIKLIGTALEFASANPVVLIAAAVIALGVAFYVAWKKSAGFRDVMKYIAQGFLGAGIIIVQVNKAIVSSFLSMVGTVLHAAATAFGWVPGLGSKLRGASRAFDGFKAGVDKTFDGVIGKMRQWQDSLDKTRSTSHDAAVKMTADFTRQGAAAKQAATDLGKYTAAIEKNHVNSDAAKAARASLIADLRKAGVNSSTARTDVAAYTEAVRVNGTKSEQARQARIRLNSDIATAFRNSQQGKRDINNLSEAIRQHGAKSDAARGARSRLLQDLISTGLDSRTAKTLVNNLQTAISNLKGKTVQIRMDGKGVYIISQGSGSAPIIAGKAAGGFITGGIPGRDSVLIRAMPGEVVVPTRMVKAGAVDHLRGQLPGFASGGQVSGPLTAPFVSGMYSSFQNQMAGSMVGAMRTSLKTAEAAAIAAAKAAARPACPGPGRSAGTPG